MRSVFSSALFIAIPTSVISSEIPVTLSFILTWASAAEYCAFIISFLALNSSTLVDKRFSASCILRSSSFISAICLSRLCVCNRLAFLRSSASRARSSLFASRALAACPSSSRIFSHSLDFCISSLLRDVVISARPLLNLFSISTCLT